MDFDLQIIAYFFSFKSFDRGYHASFVAAAISFLKLILA